MGDYDDSDCGPVPEHIVAELNSYFRINDRLFGCGGLGIDELYEIALQNFLGDIPGHIKTSSRARMEPNLFDPIESLRVDLMASMCAFALMVKTIDDGHWTIGGDWEEPEEDDDERTARALAHQPQPDAARRLEARNHSRTGIRR